MFDLFRISDLAMMQFAVYMLFSLVVIFIVFMIAFKEVKKIRFLLVGNLAYLLMHVSVIININTAFDKGIFVALFNLLGITFIAISIYEVNEKKIPIIEYLLANAIHLIIIIILAFTVGKFTIQRSITTFFLLYVVIKGAYDIRLSKSGTNKIDFNFLVLFLTFVSFNIIIVITNLLLFPNETSIESIQFTIVVFTFTTVMFILWINGSIFFSAYHLLNQKYLYLSYHDELTGIYNRRYFLDQLQRSLELMKRGKFAFSILSIDINGFKLINDEYGHNKGDEFLVEFAEFLTSTLRSSDIVTRYGGDEFVILAYISEEDESKELVDRLQLSNETKRFTSQQFQISFSIGSIFVQEAKNGITAKELLDQVDKELYKSKNEK